MKSLVPNSVARKHTLQYNLYQISLFALQGKQLMNVAVKTIAAKFIVIFFYSQVCVIYFLHSSQVNGVSNSSTQPSIILTQISRIAGFVNTFQIFLGSERHFYHHHFSRKSELKCLDFVEHNLIRKTKAEIDVRIYLNLGLRS